jgi:DNA polymerase
VPSIEERRAALRTAYEQAQGCVRCPQLAENRRTVVFGAGNADADLMFIGEAPGANEDEAGLPFVGRSGQLLERLLGEVGLAREDVFIQNVLCCRPPGNRDPLPLEIENCQSWLLEKIRLVEPRVVCTLGNFATKLLRREPVGITQLHGQPEIREIGGRAVRLYPLFHPAAALYTPSNVEVLRSDIARIPELLALDPPPQPGAPEPDPAVPVAAPMEDLIVPAGQLGLF